MASQALKEAREAVAELEKDMRAIHDLAGPEGDLSKVDFLVGSLEEKIAQAGEKAEKFTQANQKMLNLQRIEQAQEFLRQNEADQEADAQNAQDSKRVGYGKAMMQSIYKSQEKGEFWPGYTGKMRFKALFRTDAGWEPESVRSGRVVPMAVTPVELLDLFPTIATGQEMYKWMEETTLTNAATEIPEAPNTTGTGINDGVYQEATIEFTERETPVRKIGVTIPMTKEQMEDQEGAEEWVEMRLRDMLRWRLDGQVLNGNGTSPNLRGLLQTTGVTTQAKVGATPQADEIFDLMTDIRHVAYATPTNIIMHPTDWQIIALAKGTDGHYLNDRAIVNTLEQMVWGVPVTLTSRIAAGVCLVGDFNYSTMVDRQMIETDSTDVHGTNFTRDVIQFKASLRTALAVLRPAAFRRATNFSATA